jgi:hypothetical protein
VSERGGTLGKLRPDIFEFSYGTVVAGAGNIFTISLDFLYNFFVLRYPIIYQLVDLHPLKKKSHFTYRHTDKRNTHYASSSSLIITLNTSNTSTVPVTLMEHQIKHTRTKLR